MRHRRLDLAQVRRPGVKMGRTGSNLRRINPAAPRPMEHSEARGTPGEWESPFESWMARRFQALRMPTLEP